jgi:type II secretory pathway pseudopilin PulG
MKEITKMMKNEQGMALVTVLLVFVVVSVLGLSLMGMAASNLKMSTGERNNESSYYIAESGVTHILEEVRTKSAGFYNTITNPTNFFDKFEDDFMVGTDNLPSFEQFDTSFGQNPSAKIRLDRIDHNPDTSDVREYMITSEGIIGNRSRIVEKRITVKWIPKKVVIPEDTAIVVNSSIELKNAKIIGSIGVYATLDSILTGNGDKTEITGDEFATPVKIPLPPFPAFPAAPGTTDFIANSNSTLSLTTDVTSYNNFIVRPSNGKITNLTIDVGNTNKSIVINNFNIDGKITIIGTGKLNIYIARDFIISSTSIINNVDQITQLEIFLKGSGVPSNPKNIENWRWKLYGSIFAEDANINPFQNNEGIQGNIITGGKLVDQLKGTENEVPRLLFTPYASFTVDAPFRGIIIANSLVLNGYNNGITFEDVENTDISTYFPDVNVGGSGVIEYSTTTRERD